MLIDVLQTVDDVYQNIYREEKILYIHNFPTHTHALTDTKKKIKEKESQTHSDYQPNLASLSLLSFGNLLCPGKQKRVEEEECMTH